MKRSAVVLLGLFLCFASTANSQSDVTLMRWKFIDNFVDNAIDLPVTTSLADIMALGKVKKIDVKYYDASYSKSVVLEMWTFQFDGLIIVAHFYKRDYSKAQLSKAIVTGPKWKIHKDLNIGSTVQTVFKTLGVPTATTANSHEYCGETECVAFDIVDNKVLRVTLNYYLD